MKKTNSNVVFVANFKQIQREKAKARTIRNSQWWKNRRACNLCHYCRKSVPAKQLTMDHLIPVSRGGLSERKNLVPSCKECNNQKKNMLTNEWEEHLCL